MDAAESVTAGGPGTPVPVRLTLCGLPEALSVIVTAAENPLADCGVNVTLIVHDVFAASVAGLSGQLFVCPKSTGFAPVTAMLLIVSGPVPVFVRVIPCAVLVVF